MQRLYPGGGAYVAGSLSDLGALYTQQGELAQAYSYYERALALRLKAYPGGIHPSVAEIYRSLSALAQKLGQGARAQEYAQQATRIDAEMKQPLRCPELESG